jgi:signal transduction histidine kinase
LTPFYHAICHGIVNVWQNPVELAGAKFYGEVMHTPTSIDRPLTLMVIGIGHLPLTEWQNRIGSIGHTAIYATSTVQALELLARQQPDLILLRLESEGDESYETIRQIRAFYKRRWLPIVVFANDVGESQFFKAIEAGADDYLSSPFHQVLFEAKIRQFSRVLALRSKLSALARRQTDINDNVMDAVVTVNVQGRVEDANRAAFALFGRSADSPLIGHDAAELFGLPLDDLLVTPNIKLTVDKGNVIPVDVRVSDWEENGELRHTLTVRDISAEKKLERIKDEFLATVSHELRTPLASVLGALGLVVSGAAGTVPREASNLLDVAYRNGRRLSRLIDDLLDITKFEAEQDSLSLRPVAVLPLVHEGLASVKHFGQGTPTKFRLIEGVGFSSDTMANLDPDRFLQILSNLLSNAIKFSPPDQPIVISLSCNKSALTLAVRDHGQGIDPSLHERLFEKFTQADGSDSRGFSGTGLGLYITRLLVEKMGGRIGIEQPEGRGTQFTITVPTVAPAIQRRTRRVLHIADDLDERLRVATWLQNSFELKSAASVESLTASFAEWPADDAPVIIANPQGQEGFTAFCGSLRTLTTTESVLIFSDSVSKETVESQGFQWLSNESSNKRDLITRLLALMPHSSKSLVLHE